MQDERGTVHFLYMQGSQHYTREHHITERNFSASPVASDLFDVKDQIHRYDTQSHRQNMVLRVHDSVHNAYVFYQEFCT